MIGIDFLKKTEILAGLDDGKLKSVAECCQEKEFQNGQNLFSEGENAEHLWIVMEGQVDIRFDLPGKPSSEENNISSVRETKTFGWSSIVPPNIYTLSAYCASRKCKVVAMERKRLFDLFAKDPAVGYKVMLNGMGVVGERFDKILRMASPIPAAKVKITVHMATCGIAAGARDVMKALADEIAKTDRKDIEAESGRCLGKCPTEPNVTVKFGWEDPVVYQHMDAAKMRRVFEKHILSGEVQTDLVLAE